MLILVAIIAGVAYWSYRHGKRLGSRLGFAREGGAVALSGRVVRQSLAAAFRSVSRACKRGAELNAANCEKNEVISLAIGNQVVRLRLSKLHMGSDAAERILLIQTFQSLTLAIMLMLFVLLLGAVGQGFNDGTVRMPFFDRYLGIIQQRDNLAPRTAIF